MTTATVGTQRTTLNLRVKEDMRDLIDRAAKAQGKNRTSFILDAARLAAEEALLNQALIQVSPEAYAEFVQRLDQPANPNAKLRKTLQAPTPWNRA